MMGNNPRRIYIFTRPVQDDDAAGDGWPQGTTAAPRLSDDRPQYTSSDYPENYLDQGGGLLGMLLRGMQHDRDLPNANSQLASNAASETSPDGFGDPQSGLIGRLATMQAESTPAQPSIARDQLPISDPRNPNFRQLSRAPISNRTQREIDSHPFASYLTRGDGGPSEANSGVLGAYGDRSARPSTITAPTQRTAQLVWPGRGLPIAPVGPANPHPIPVPTIPDWWKAAGPILRGIFSRRPIGGYNDDYSRCMKAASSGTNQWEEFCRNLGAGTNNTSGGESQKRACWSKTFESPENKELWCRNQFGKGLD